MVRRYLGPQDVGQSGPVPNPDSSEKPCRESVLIVRYADECSLPIDEKPKGNSGDTVCKVTSTVPTVSLGTPPENHKTKVEINAFVI